jgi:hypothetical protein
MGQSPTSEADGRSAGEEISRLFMKPEGSLQFSQETTNGILSEPNKSIPYPQIHFNTNLPLTSISLKWSLYFAFHE